ncbi:uncharacterized protein M421DRAFT_391143 [Didymella exigua CBS 183.55]
MSREELLEVDILYWPLARLLQQLTSYLDRGFIRVSKSSASALVLFAWKPGRGL